jgi:hypothetical protein
MKIKIYSKSLNVSSKILSLHKYCTLREFCVRNCLFQKACLKALRHS